VANAKPPGSAYALVVARLMFFAFHDDVIDPTYVESLVRALNDNPGAILSYSDVEVTEVSGSSAVWSFDRLLSRT
jgi:hypothetical protein